MFFPGFVMFKSYAALRFCQTINVCGRNPDRQMKVTTTRRVCFFEVNEQFELRLKVLLNYMQEAAAVHSEQAGYAAPVLMEQHKAWVLHRIGMRIDRLPAFGDSLEIVTWHRGARGFRSYRDFAVYCNGEKRVSATSLWLFIDLARKKILKPPKGAQELYTVENANALDMDIDRWKPDLSFQPEAGTAIHVRASDYDPLGHVNNAVYFDYLETLVERALGRPGNIRNIRVQFNREIPRAVTEVAGGLKKQDGGYMFKITSAEGVNAAGEFAEA